MTLKAYDLIDIFSNSSLRGTKHPITIGSQSSYEITSPLANVS